MAFRSIHLTVGAKDGCGSSTKHIGAYGSVSFAEFVAIPAERQCQRCLNGKLFAFMLRTQARAALPAV